MNNSPRLTVITLLLAVPNLYADWWYVAPGSTYSNIQQAVDAAAAGDEIDVDDGMYPGGVVVSKPLAVISVNGPEFTAINGTNHVQCVYLTGGASLTGFTLTNGLALRGAGVECASIDCFITNCIITHNFAESWIGLPQLGGVGGGVYGGTLYNCTLRQNVAVLNPLWYRGAGAYGSTLYNCTLTQNYGGDGAGACQCTLYNCVVYYNEDWNDVPSDRFNYYNCTLNYCCTTPLPSNGVSNITFDPLFEDRANGDSRLSPDSPCINAGNNAYGTTDTDLDGNPRIDSGTVDIGAYEYQGAASVISYAWLQHYGLLTDGSADFADPDNDGVINWQEWVCGTAPTNPLSALRMVSVLQTNASATVTWESAAGVSYFLERSTNVASAFSLAGTNIVGQAGTTSYTDTNATGAGLFFYRVRVNSPW
jgi:hypothetical protein